MYDDITLDDDEIVMKNPNLYITLSSSGGLWSAAIFPWQEQYPWTFNQQY